MVATQFPLTSAPADTWAADDTDQETKPEINQPEEERRGPSIMSTQCNTRNQSTRTEDEYEHPWAKFCADAMHQITQEIYRRDPWAKYNVDAMRLITQEIYLREEDMPNNADEQHRFNIRIALEMAAEELRRWQHGIDDAVKNHRYQSELKPLARRDEQFIWNYDHGNYSGSIAIMMLLDYGLLDILQYKDELQEHLRLEGTDHQKSGRGPNNYRTNLLESILTDVGKIHDRGQCSLALLWQYVNKKIQAYEKNNYHELWNLSQKQLCSKLLHDKTDVDAICSAAYVICDQEKLWWWPWHGYVSDMLTALRADPEALHENSYNEDIRRVTRCGEQSQSRMRTLIQVAKDTLTEFSMLEETSRVPAL